MNLGMKRLAAIFTLGIFILVPATMALSQDADSEQEATFRGELTQTEEDGYVLIEQESGESISLLGTDELLADYVGDLIEVTGTWDEADDGTEHLAVTSVERATS